MGCLQDGAAGIIASSAVEYQAGQSGWKIEIDQSVIGSCTNGRISDLRIAAGFLKGKKVHPRVRTIVIPGTQQIYLDAMHEGLVEIFINAGAVVSTPTCGPCLGGYMGILAAGEKAISTTNRTLSVEWAALNQKFIWRTRLSLLLVPLPVEFPAGGSD